MFALVSSLFFSLNRLNPALVARMALLSAALVSRTLLNTELLPQIRQGNT